MKVAVVDWPDLSPGNSHWELFKLKCQKYNPSNNELQAEFRYESPISISKWKNWLDFGRKSENYFKVKFFSDSRPKSAQKLSLKLSLKVSVWKSMISFIDKKEITGC